MATLNDLFGGSTKGQAMEFSRVLAMRGAEVRRAQNAIRQGHTALANHILERVAYALEQAAANVKAAAK